MRIARSGHFSNECGRGTRVLAGPARSGNCSGGSHRGAQCPARPARAARAASEMDDTAASGRCGRAAPARAGRAPVRRGERGHALAAREREVRVVRGSRDVEVVGAASPARAAAGGARATGPRCRRGAARARSRAAASRASRVAAGGRHVVALAPGSSVSHETRSGAAVGARRRASYSGAISAMRMGPRPGGARRARGRAARAAASARAGDPGDLLLGTAPTRGGSAGRSCDDPALTRSLPAWNLRLPTGSRLIVPRPQAVSYPVFPFRIVQRRDTDSRIWLSRFES